MAEYGTTTPGQPAAQPQMPAEGFGSLPWWKDQIEASEEKIKRYTKRWKVNVDRYLAQPLTIAPAVDTVVVPLDFANVEQKKALLYFRNPDVDLSAAPGHEAQADAIQAFRHLLNETLGPDGVDAETMMDELLSDVLCPSGIGFSVLGMEVTTDGTTQMQMGTEPSPQPGAVLGLSDAGQVPVMQPVPNIIHQQYFWSRISPLYGLLPARFHGKNFDNAPWLGYKFEIDKQLGIRQFGLTEDEANKAGDEPDRLNTDETPKGRDTDVIYGYCISYKGSLYRSDVKHPEEIWRLMVIKGVDRIIKHDRPYQKMAPDGKTIIGMRGHFIHVYVPRYVSDSAIPPSDVSMSRHQVDELSKGRSQMIQQRDRAKPMRWLNINNVDPAQKDKIVRGEWQDIVLTTTDGKEMMGEVAHAQFSRENFEFNRIIKADVSETWAFGSNQRGNAEETRRTATELSIQQNASDTRMEKERRWLLKWYCRGAEKLGGLLQLFEDDRTTVEIIGPDNQQRLVPWDRKALPLRFIATAKPDTMVRNDSQAEDKRDLDFYQMTANDPHMNRVELLVAMCRKRGYDPKMVTRELPPKSPEDPKLSLSITGDDLNPSMPQFPIVQQLLTAGGIQIDPNNVTLGLSLAAKQQTMGAPTPHDGSAPVPGQAPPNGAHGGAAQTQEPLSKHSADLTGRLPGAGAPHAGAVQ